MKSDESKKTEKSEALRLLVHFVADVHQPLHINLYDDKGGNDCKVIISQSIEKLICIKFGIH